MIACTSSVVGGWPESWTGHPRRCKTRVAGGGGETETDKHQKIKKRNMEGWPGVWPGGEAKRQSLRSSLRSELQHVRQLLKDKRNRKNKLLVSSSAYETPWHDHVKKEQADLVVRHNTPVFATDCLHVCVCVCACTNQSFLSP